MANHRRFTRLFSGAAVLTGLSLTQLSSAAAEGVACHAMAPSAQGSAATLDPVIGYQVLRSHKLFRTQARPWAQIPTGVSLLVKVPAHTTFVDLHNALQACASKGDANSPLCVKGASFHVSREGGYYVVNVTSAQRGTALEIQHRAERLGV